MAVWLSIGLIVCGALSYHPPRYFYFSLLPLHFVVVAAVVRVVGRISPTLAMPICGGLLSLQLASQLPLYFHWWQRDPADSQMTMAKKTVDLIETQGTETIMVIGQLAPFLGLFSPRIRPMEAMFVPTSRYSLCDRIDHWRPRIHVDTPPEGSRSLEEIARCEPVSGLDELTRIPVFGDSPVVVTRVSYGDEDPRQARTGQHGGY